MIHHVQQAGFTHVEFLPLMEHPFYGSWGYQTTGFFAPTSRYGTPQELMYLIDQLHQAGIGVIFDWVPSHFPEDPFALAQFDGTHLFEHADPRLGFHPDWKSLIFNYGRHEVRSFLASSAEHWLSHYHVDGLRVDAVASMLYLDYSRRPGEWIPNAHGGRENLEALEFLRRLNTGIYADHPDVQVIAEESTAFPGVSRPVDAGGVGFGLKWDMGWMHDTLRVPRARSGAPAPPPRRAHVPQRLCLQRELHAPPLPRRGGLRQAFAPRQRCRATTGSASPTCACSTGTSSDSRARSCCSWATSWRSAGSGTTRAVSTGVSSTSPPHAGILRWVGDLNRLYREQRALHDLDTEPGGFSLDPAQRAPRPACSASCGCRRTGRRCW